MLEKVLDILSLGNEHHYLQFPGGSGGDFLSGTISRHSDIYANNVTHIEKNNKFKTEVPYFFRIMTAMSANDTEGKDMNTLATHWCKDWEKFSHIPKYNFKKVINEAKEWLTEGKRLIRIHPSYYEYFENKTFFLYPDNDYWNYYCRYMMTLKLYTRMINSNEFKTITKHYIESLKNQNLTPHSQYSQVFDFLKNFDKPILQGHIYLIQYFDFFKSFENIFSLDKSEVIRFLYNNKELTNNPMFKKIDFYMMPNTILLPMSKVYLEEDFLKNIFNIRSDSFFDEVHSWHLDNLKLLSQQGIKHET